jgi:hypothetical protein
LPSADDPRLDEVAEEIRAVVRQAGLERVLAIGALVLERFFNGSVAEWRNRRRRKNNSVHRLAERPGCPLSRSTLNDAIAVYVVTRELPWVLRGRHLESSHIVAVLPLPREAQQRWLRRAVEQRWSVRQLRDAVRAARRAEGDQRGRPRASEGRRALARSLTTIGHLEDAVALLLHAGHVAGGAQVNDLECRLGGLHSRLRSLSEGVGPQASQLMLVARRLATGARV